MRTNEPKINKSSKIFVPQKDKNQKNVKPIEPVVDLINLKMTPDLSYPIAANQRKLYYTRLQQTYGNQYVQKSINKHNGEFRSIQRQIEEEEESIQAKNNELIQLQVEPDTEEEGETPGMAKAIGESLSLPLMIQQSPG